MGLLLWYQGLLLCLSSTGSTGTTGAGGTPGETGTQVKSRLLRSDIDSVVFRANGTAVFRLLLKVLPLPEKTFWMPLPLLL